MLPCGKARGTERQSINDLPRNGRPNASAVPDRTLEQSGRNRDCRNGQRPCGSADRWDETTNSLADRLRCSPGERPQRPEALETPGREADCDGPSCAETNGRSSSSVLSLEFI